MTPLTHAECLRHLAEGRTGRIAVTHRALPVIVPVTYALSGPSVVFRTQRGGMLASACDDAVVAFEIDDVRTGGTADWSVLVVGMARLLDGSAVLRALELGLVSAAGSDLDQFVTISIGEVSGRQVSSNNSPRQASAVGGAS